MNVHASFSSWEASSGKKVSLAIVRRVLVMLIFLSALFYIVISCGSGGGRGGGGGSAEVWGTPVPIETDAGDAFEPQIAMDGSGNAFAV